MTALVSVYRASRFLEGCLDDLLAQSLGDKIEIIVIDSGSPEHEREIVARYREQHSNIKYIRTEKRETLYQAWNRGIEVSSGRYLTSANADDRHHPEFAERLVSLLDSSHETALAWADAWVTADENPCYGESSIVGRFRWPDFDRDKLFTVCYVGPQPVWRRDLHEQHGLFDGSMIAAGDYEFWLRLAVSETFAHVREPLGLYHYSPSSIEHANRSVSRVESDRARHLHWNDSWGARPRPKGNYLYWKPSFWVKELVRGRLLPPPRPV